MYAKNKFKPSKEELYRLYVIENKTTRQIASLFPGNNKFGTTSKTQVLRWLDFYEIKTKPSGCGLAYRGLPVPTRDELYKMIHEDRMTYESVAKQYKVDQSAVYYWVKIYKIKQPQIRNSSTIMRNSVAISRDILAELYLVNHLSLCAIAEIYGVNGSTISDRCKKWDIPVRPDGFHQARLLCDDGHLVRSGFELKVDNWLFKNSIEHVYEPKLPFGHHNSKADFLIGYSYLEIWGVVGVSSYVNKKNWKIQQYKNHNLNLIELNYEDFYNGGLAWIDILEKFYKKAS